jgi:hypothetical protein
VLRGRYRFHTHSSHGLIAPNCDPRFCEPNESSQSLLAYCIIASHPLNSKRPYYSNHWTRQRHARRGCQAMQSSGETTFDELHVSMLCSKRNIHMLPQSGQFPLSLITPNGGGSAENVEPRFTYTCKCTKKQHVRCSIARLTRICWYHLAFTPSNGAQLAGMVEIAAPMFRPVSSRFPKQGVGGPPRRIHKAPLTSIAGYSCSFKSVSKPN